MSATVFANGMSIACKVSSGKTTAAMPDVCLSPPPSPAGPIPIPYPNTSSASDTDRGSTTVSIGGEPVMLKDKSIFKTSTGDEAATKSLGMGVVTHKIQGEAQFIAWSMDVKFEAENVPRHMDLMGHNEACNPSQTPPWPFLDAMAMDVPGHPCEKMAKKVKTDCKGGSDYSNKCCKARKCFLMPKTPNRCCSGSDGKKMTGHHLLPSKEFVAHAKRSGADPLTNYVSNKAPCLCVEGPDHSGRTEHGRVGRQYTKLKNLWMKAPANKGKTYTLSVGTRIGAQTAVGKVKGVGCTEECLNKQLDDGHAKMSLVTGPDDPLPRSKQPPSAPMVLD